MADAIRKGMLVTISLVMADMTGRTLEETPPEGMVYLHGEGDIFPRLEKALEGHFAGEGFTIHLEPEEAFGEYDAGSDIGRKDVDHGDTDRGAKHSLRNILFRIVDGFGVCASRFQTEEGPQSH